MRGVGDRMIRRHILTLILTLGVLISSGGYVYALDSQMDQIGDTEENLNEVATVTYVYNQIGNQSIYSESVTIQDLASLLAEKIPTSYENYEYYRSHINDTSNRDILKCYSEGLISTDEKGNIDPERLISKLEVQEILSRIDDPIEVERPTYKEELDIPILMYHELGELPLGGDPSLFVAYDNFIDQLDTLQREGYNTVSMEQLYQHWENMIPLPENPLVLTFDDGYKSHYNFAAVELEKRGMTGTFYLQGRKIGLNTETPPSMVRQMYERGMEIGSHTVNHINAKHEDDFVLTIEYIISKYLLENILDIEIRHFCYPFGDKTESSDSILNELGYKTALLTANGIANNHKQGLFGLHRKQVGYYDDIEDFMGKLMVDTENITEDMIEANIE